MVNTTLLGLTGYISNDKAAASLATGIAGIILCWAWYALIISYKKLNGAKFRVILCMEKLLPLAPYDAEWGILKRGEDAKHYKPLTHVETYVPWVFGLLHVLAIIFFIQS